MKNKYVLCGLLLCATLVIVPCVIDAACSHYKAGTFDNGCGSGDCSYTEYDQLVICIVSAANEDCKEQGTMVNTKSRVVSGQCSQHKCTVNLSYGEWSDPVPKAAMVTNPCQTS